MERMMHTARFQPMTGSSSESVAGAGEDESSSKVSVSDCISGVFSVAVAVVERLSLSGWSGFTGGVVVDDVMLLKFSRRAW
jgi:hypothetical protein